VSLSVISAVSSGAQPSNSDLPSRRTDIGEVDRLRLGQGHIGVQGAISRRAP
jgi:hypothetical protein